MVRADVLYKGQMIGSLNRDQYLPTCGTGAFGDYLYIQFEDGFCLFFDKELNQINDFVVSDGKPSEYMESDGTYYHLPTLRKAFVSGSTVTADEVSDSVKAIDGNIVDLQGNVVIPAEYMSLAEGAGELFFANGYQAAYSAEGQVCFFDMAGNVTASSAKGVGYLMLEGFSYNSPIIGIEGEEGYTLFSAVKGELTEVYDDVDTWYTSQPVISVEKNGLWGCVDMMGNQVIPFVFSGIPDISNDGTLVVGETAESVYTVYKLAY